MEISYFNREELEKKADRLRNSNRSGSWLPEVILELAKSSALFPLEEDAERYVIEYIYPH
jgi:hypothetical protein